MVRFTMKHAVALTILTFVFIVHSFCPVTTSFDSRWTVHLAVSLLHRGDLDLDEYETKLREGQFYAIHQIGGHYYSAFPPGGPVVVVPLVLALEQAMAIAEPVIGYRIISPPLRAMLARDFVSAHDTVELLLASFLVAATAAAVFYVASDFLPVWFAMLPSLVFAFATPAWSTGSRAVWQHTPSMLMLAIALWILVKALQRPCLVQFAALPLAIAYCVRPTNAIAAAVFTVYVALYYRRWLPHWIAWALPVSVAFFWFNLSVYGHPLSPYYRTGPGELLKIPFILAAQLLSPSRGLLVFTPVLVFAVWGAVLAWRSDVRPPLFRYVVAVALLHTLLLSMYHYQWWGGHSYGPRFFTDMMPFLAVLLIPVLQKWRENPTVAAAAVFGILLAVSVMIHARGALSHAVYSWNSRPVDIDKQPSRAWDWSDPQFLRR